jgi:hypothetical protein
MFNIFGRSQSHALTVRQALAQAGLPGATDPSRIGVFEEGGQYSGRRVTFFRAFEPGHQDIPLASGHIERDGAVVVNDLHGPQVNPLAREPANRTNHPDDERLVFWDADSARVSEAALSQPAATWSHAQSSSESER